MGRVSLCYRPLYFLRNLAPEYWDHLLGFTLLEPRRSYDHRVYLHLQISQHCRPALRSKLDQALQRFLDLMGGAGAGSSAPPGGAAADEPQRAGVSAASERDFRSLRVRDLCPDIPLHRPIDPEKYLTAEFFGYRLKVLEVDEVDWPTLQEEKFIGFDTVGVDHIMINKKI